MELVKVYNQTDYDLVTVENGKEVGGNRTEEELYADGYRMAVLTDNPYAPEGYCTWEEISNGYVQVWHKEEDAPDA